MAKQHTEQLKHDPLMDQYMKTTAWVKPRTKPILTALAAIAAVLVLWFGYQWFSKRSAERATDAMSTAYKIEAAPVADPLPPTLPGNYAFKTEEEKNRKTVEAFEKIASDYPSQYGDIATYYAAIHKLDLDGGAKGEEALKSLANKNSIISSKARLTLAERYEATGKFNEALAEYQKLKAAPGNVSDSLVDFNTARTYEALGKTQEASDLYFNLASQNRDKPASINTKALLQLATLDPARVDKLPEPEKKDLLPSRTKIATAK